jgi:TPR repeat protein
VLYQYGSSANEYGLVIGFQRPLGYIRTCGVPGPFPGGKVPGVFGGIVVNGLTGVLFLACLPLAAQSSLDARYVNKSYSRVAKVILSADNGSAKAQFDAGLMHETGDVVQQNHKEALKWFTLSAEDGYAPAQLFLGLMYASGKGAAQNYTEALKWVRRAAEQGNADAQFYLCGLYLSDGIVPHNYVESYKWFLLGTASNDSAKKDAIKNGLVKNASDSSDAKKALLELMTPAQVADAEHLATEWRAKADKTAKK